MDSRQGSFANASGFRSRKSSAANARYARQASLSLQLEQGRFSNRHSSRNDGTSPVSLDGYVLGKKLEGVPALARADTSLDPLEEGVEHRVRRPFHPSSHPGQRWGERRATDTQSIIQTPGAFQKPFDEPKHFQTKVEHRPIQPKTPDQDEGDLAKVEMQRVVSTASHNPGPIVRSFRRLLGKPAIEHGVASGLGFAASLPTVHARAVLNQVDGPAEDHRRLYIVEYSHTKDVLRSTAPQPFDGVGSLNKYLTSTEDICDLRLIYACNDRKAFGLLARDFGISGVSVESGERSLQDWMQADPSSRRALGKAIKWRPSYDAARDLVCSAFALDFGKVLVAASSEAGQAKCQSVGAGLIESTHRQRVAVYMQRRASTVSAAGARSLRSSPTTLSSAVPKYALCPTIIIAEYSATGINDVVSTGSLLGLDIPGSDLPTVVSKAMQDIMSHVTEGIQRLWHQQVHLLHEPHAELEDHIFSQPSDPSRAREIWAMSQRLHQILKLLNRHTSLIEDVQDDFRPFAELQEDQDWLDPIIEELQDLSETIDVDYVQPMDRMIDLMYKSVTIRDSRQSLELNASLWRLSWITFIFLPLTALSGFFGMNVDTFKEDPSIKWYFISAAPLLTLVVTFWFSVRTFAPASKRADLAMEIGDMMSKDTKASKSRDGDIHDGKRWRWLSGDRQSW